MRKIKQYYRTKLNLTPEKGRMIEDTIFVITLLIGSQVWRLFV